MLERLHRIICSRWTFAVLVLGWIVLAASLVDLLWDRAAAKQAMFDIAVVESRRAAAFVWLTLIVAAYAAHGFRTWSRGYYGLLEMLVGILGGSIALEELNFTKLTSWLAIAGSVFVLLRGVENLRLGVSAADNAKARQ